MKHFRCPTFIVSAPSIITILQGMAQNDEQLDSNRVYFMIALFAGLFLATPWCDGLTNVVFQVVESKLAYLTDELGCDSGPHRALDFVQRIRLLLPTPSMFTVLCAGNIGFQNFCFMQEEASLRDKRCDIYNRVGALFVMGVVATVSAYVYSSTSGFFGILTLSIVMAGSLIALVYNPTKVLNEYGEGNHLRVMVTWFAWAVVLNAGVALAFEQSPLEKIGRVALGFALTQALFAFVFLGGFFIESFTPSAEP
jgi:hypothetical protein